MPYELMWCTKGDERYNRILKKEGIQSDEEWLILEITLL